MWWSAYKLRLTVCYLTPPDRPHKPVYREQVFFLLISQTPQSLHLCCPVPLPPHQLSSLMLGLESRTVLLAIPYWISYGLSRPDTRSFSPVIQIEGRAKLLGMFRHLTGSLDTYTQDDSLLSSKPSFQYYFQLSSPCAGSTGLSPLQWCTTNF